MGERIALTQCINPNHDDSTPSMAVYDHGKDKLQVFCFGCKYHAWVDPIDIDLKPHIERTNNYVPGTDTGTLCDINSCSTVKPRLSKYCRDRNLSDSSVDALYDRVTIGYDGRPYMEWSIYDITGKYVGWQRRYLDDEHPKTRYSKGINIDNTSMLYTTSLVTNSMDYGDARAIYIAESAFDVFWLQQTKHIPESIHMYTTLGTPDHINWSDDIKNKLRFAKKMFLYFDRDIPGDRTSHAIMRYKDYINCDIDINNMMEEQPEGTKVYQI